MKCGRSHRKTKKIRATGYSGKATVTLSSKPIKRKEAEVIVSSFHKIIKRPTLIPLMSEYQRRSAKGGRGVLHLMEIRNGAGSWNPYMNMEIAGN